MTDRSPFLLWTELDETTMPALGQMATAETGDLPRSCSYPNWPLDAVLRRAGAVARSPLLIGKVSVH